MRTASIVFYSIAYNLSKKAVYGLVDRILKMASSDYFAIQLPSILPTANTTSNWGRHYIGAIGSVENIIRQGSSTPSEMTTTNAFPSKCEAYFGALTASCPSSTSLFFVASSSAQISILHKLHQVQNIGAPSKFYALLGFGSKASLVNIPNEAFSRRPPVEVLSGHIISSRGSFNVTENLIGSTVQCAFRPLIPIPNFLASYILGALAGDVSSSISPSTMLKAVTTACKSLSEAVDESINVTFDWEDECECVLQYLSAANGGGFGVEINRVPVVEMSSELSTWFSDVHSMLGHTPLAGRNSGSNPSSERNNNNNNSEPNHTTNDDNSMMAQILQSQQQIADRLVKSNETSISVQSQLADAITKRDSGHKSKHWNQLSSDKRQMALSAASTDGESIAAALPASGTEFFMASATSAKSVLESYIGASFPKFMVSYPSLLIHYLRNMLIIWSRNDCPEGVSIFFTPSSMPEVGAFRSDLTADLEASQGTGFSTETVQTQTKQMKPSIPSRYNELLHQVQNFYAIFAVIFGKESCIAMALAFVVDEIDKNEQLLITYLSSSSEFALGLLFAIDSTVQRFFRVISSQPISSEATMILDELATIMHKVASFSFSAPLIPFALRQLIIPVDTSSSQHKRESTTDLPAAHKKKTVKNDRISTRWVKRTGESFNVFSTHKAQAPLISGVPVCLKYHILGSCASNCPRISTHVPLTGDASTRMSEFVKNCREYNPPTTHDGATTSVPSATISTISPNVGPDQHHG